MRQELSDLRKDLLAAVSEVKDIVVAIKESAGHAALSGECFICNKKPVRVFSCTSCDNWFCELCHDRLDDCPMCRTDFKATPSARNKAVERVLGL